MHCGLAEGEYIFPPLFYDQLYHNQIMKKNGAPNFFWIVDLRHIEISEGVNVGGGGSASARMSMKIEKKNIFFDICE